MVGVPRVKTGKPKQVGDAQVHTKGGEPAADRTKPRGGDESHAGTRASHGAALSGTSLSHLTTVSRWGLGLYTFPVTVAYHTERGQAEGRRGEGQAG